MPPLAFPKVFGTEQHSSQLQTTKTWLLKTAVEITLNNIRLIDIERPLMVTSIGGPVQIPRTEC
jgi:hypothetical protein